MRLLLCLVIALSAGFLIKEAVVYAGCPECFYDYIPLQGTATVGRPATIDGRPAISIRIDGSWDTSPGSHQTNANVWSATQSAINAWNTATDVSGQPANYYLDLRQTDASAQITIVRGGENDGACATTTGKLGGPYVIHLPKNADQRTLDALIQTIMHELGHVYGLDEPTSACPGDKSIMNGNSGGVLNRRWNKCNGTDRSITPNDVQKANTTSSPGGPPAGYCNHSAVAHPVFNEPPGGGGGGGYVEPNYYYYPTVCYYYYEAQDAYTCSTIDGNTHCTYQGTRYYLTDVFCY